MRSEWSPTKVGAEREPLCFGHRGELSPKSSTFDPPPPLLYENGQTAFSFRGKALLTPTRGSAHVGALPQNPSYRLALCTWRGPPSPCDKSWICSCSCAQKITGSVIHTQRYLKYRHYTKRTNLLNKNTHLSTIIWNM